MTLPIICQLIPRAYFMAQITNIAFLHTSFPISHPSKQCPLRIHFPVDPATITILPRPYQRPTFQHRQSTPPQGPPRGTRQLLHAIATMSADFWAGYVSGAVGIIIGNPLDLIKTRLQAGPSQDVSTGTGTATAVAGRGFRGQFENAGTLVRGTTPKSTLLRGLEGEWKLIAAMKCRRNSTHSRLRRVERPALHDIQPHAHTSRRLS